MDTFFIKMVTNYYFFFLDKSEVGVNACEGNKLCVTVMYMNSATQIKKVYPNTKIILAMIKDIETHKKWIREKFEVITLAKNSNVDLIGLSIGKTHVIEIQETAESKREFISEILSEVSKIYSNCKNQKQKKNSSLKNNFCFFFLLSR